MAIIWGAALRSRTEQVLFGYDKLFGCDTAGPSLELNCVDTSIDTTPRVKYANLMGDNRRDK